MTEEEVIQIIQKIANKLSYKFTFGPYTREDIRQEAFIIGMDGLKGHDGIRPLENFLWRHIRNRLCNFKRDNFIRHTKPCYQCPLNAYVQSTGTCTAFEDTMQCTPYAAWFKKTSAKRNIINPIGISCVSDERENNMRQNSDVNSATFYKQVVDIIDKNVDMSLRQYWLKTKSGAKVPKQFRDKLKQNITAILEENNIDVASWTF
jgi:hypothetical protein